MPSDEDHYRSLGASESTANLLAYNDHLSKLNDKPLSYQQSNTSAVTGRHRASPNRSSARMSGEGKAAFALLFCATALLLGMWAVRDWVTVHVPQSTGIWGGAALVWIVYLTRTFYLAQRPLLALPELIALIALVTFSAFAPLFSGDHYILSWQGALLVPPFLASCALLRLAIARDFRGMDHRTHTGSPTKAIFHYARWSVIAGLIAATPGVMMVALSWVDDAYFIVSIQTVASFASIIAVAAFMYRFSVHLCVMRRRADQTPAGAC